MFIAKIICPSNSQLPFVYMQAEQKAKLNFNVVCIKKPFLCVFKGPKGHLQCNILYIVKQEDVIKELKDILSLTMTTFKSLIYTPSYNLIIKVVFLLQGFLVTHISYFYSTTKNGIIQIKKSQFSSLNPPNQSRLFNWLARYKRMRVFNSLNRGMEAQPPPQAPSCIYIRL